MKKLKNGIAISLALSILLMVGCNPSTPTNTSEPVENTTEQTQSESGSQSADLPEDLKIDYSSLLNDNGYLKNVKALDLVQLADYENISIPLSIHEVTDEVIEQEINKLLAENATTTYVTDRAIENLDTVNIDYVGSIDGVEFEGGNTNGQGAEVTIGVTSYIDDFLEQLIGHTPGEQFDINVTFPEDYHAEDLKGKEAVFSITINYISEQTTPELSDTFVAETLSSKYAVNTVEELKTFIHDELQSQKIIAYLQENLMTQSTVSEVHEDAVAYQEALMKNYYQLSAYSYGMTTDEFIAASSNYSNYEELYEANKAQLTNRAEYTLVIQAVAETLELQVSEENLKAYFLKYAGSEDYSVFVENYGLAYVNNLVLQELVHDHLINTSELATE